MESKPLVVIVGPTASGKTSLSIEIAKRYDGEIICADSRTIYKGMDIGTAKPSKAEQDGVPHWGLDLVLPGEKFSVFDFKLYAENKIKEIRDRGKIPFLVGGTGLYTDAVVFDYQFGASPNPEQREILQGLSIEELRKYCEEHNINLPENVLNKRHLIHAIEQNNVPEKRRVNPIENTIIVGIATDREVLRQRIRERSEQIFESNVVNEALMLGNKYGWKSEAMTGNIYPLIRQYSKGEISIEEAKERFITSDWRLAKRQLTWLRRNPFINWLSLDEAREYLIRALANR
ncbi:MAG TPA: tRNA (adenosine(37)-N6)-dimethylallyltransferase MiaA [Candidatus Saccharimonadales bacterium]|nr:tRNA (adenosine(37)-N6)-dimethylallyltransferase MiaA [Candidatus Saccharimonadales bacterium]